MQKLCCVRTRQQSSASLDYFVTSLPPYLHQFSSISGGNCIKTTDSHRLSVVSSLCYKEKMTTTPSPSTSDKNNNNNNMKMAQPMPNTTSKSKNLKETESPLQQPQKLETIVYILATCHNPQCCQAPLPPPPTTTSLSSTKDKSLVAMDIGVGTGVLMAWLLQQYAMANQATATTTRGE